MTQLLLCINFQFQPKEKQPVLSHTLFYDSRVCFYFDLCFFVKCYEVKIIFSFNNDSKVNLQSTLSHHQGLAKKCKDTDQTHTQMHTT